MAVLALIAGVAAMLAPVAEAIPLSEVCRKANSSTRVNLRQLDRLHDAMVNSARRGPDSFEARIETAVLELTNEKRRGERGLRPLREDRVLGDVARFHSRDMLARAYFAHETPEGVDHATRINLGHRQFVGLSAENIYAYATGISTRDAFALALAAVESWRDSPGHWRNMSNPSYTHLGVGVARRGNCYLFTQNFAQFEATLREAVPFVARRGESLDLRVSERAQIQYGLAKPGDRELALGPYPLGVGSLRVPPGVYVTRFLFPDGNRFLIYNGPMVNVRR